MSLFLALTSGINIASNLGSYSGSEKIAKEQEKLARIQSEYNKNQIKEQYKRNFSALMEEYTEKRSAFVRNATVAISEINARTANRANVDNEFDSYRIDSLNELDSKFLSNLNEITEEQVFNMRELEESRINSELNNSIQLNNTLGNINSQMVQAKNNAVTKSIMSAANIGYELLNSFETRRTKVAETSDLADSIINFGTMDKKYGNLLGGIFK